MAKAISDEWDFEVREIAGGYEFTADAKTFAEWEQIAQEQGVSVEAWLKNAIFALCDRVKAQNA